MASGVLIGVGDDGVDERWDEEALRIAERGREGLDGQSAKATWMPGREGDISRSLDSLRVRITVLIGTTLFLHSTALLDQRVLYHRGSLSLGCLALPLLRQTTQCCDLRRTSCKEACSSAHCCGEVRLRSLRRVGRRSDMSSRG